MASTKSTSLDVQLLEMSCLRLNQADRHVTVRCAVNEHGVLTDGVIIKIEAMGWCRTCHHIKTTEEMARPGVCRACVVSSTEKEEVIRLTPEEHNAIGAKE